MQYKNIKDKLVNYETISYLICGILTTLVDWCSFSVMNEQFRLDYRVSTALSWFAAVIFAYIVNKLIVFKNFQFNPAHLWKEWWIFFSARVLSGVLTMLLMILMVDIFHWGDIRLGGWSIGLYAAKAVVSAVNLVLNYLFSKWWIFKKK